MRTTPSVQWYLRTTLAGFALARRLQLLAPQRVKKN